MIDGPQSVVFDEAENRLHAQKGILAWCLHADGVTARRQPALAFFVAMPRYRAMTDPHTNPSIEIPTRAPSAVSADDTIMPFEVAAFDLRGRVVRLGPLVDEILQRHDYPAPVSKLLGEAIVLTAMLGSALKIYGRLILQTQSDGPVSMLVVDFTAPDKVRACARFDAAQVDAAHRCRQGRRRRAARHRPPRHDDRPGTRDEPLSGSGGVGWRRPRGSRPRIFPALGANPDAGPPCGGRAIRRRRGRSATGIGAPAASCCNSCRRRRSACGWPIFLLATRRKACEACMK